MKQFENSGNYQTVCCRPGIKKDGIIDSKSGKYTQQERLKMALEEKQNTIRLSELKIKLSYHCRFILGHISLSLSVNTILLSLDDYRNQSSAVGLKIWFECCPKKYH